MREYRCIVLMSRCIHSVIYDLLVSIQNTKRPIKSRICRSSNLPLDRCGKILGFLESNGFIYRYFDEGRWIYEITERGYEYIGIYEKLLELIPTYTYSLKTR